MHKSTNASFSPHARPRRFLLLLACTALLPAAALGEGIPFTAGQVERGSGIYKEHCQICHGSTLANGQFGTPLKGAFFRNKWKGKSVGELVKHTYELMPPATPMMFAPEQYAEAIAFILQANGLEPGEEQMSGDFKVLDTIPLPW